MPQFIEIWRRLDIIVKDPVVLTKNSFWFAGVFDANGCISFHLDKRQNNWLILSISISNKKAGNLQIFQDTFGGIIYVNISSSVLLSSLTWQINDPEGILQITHYFKDKCRSNKSVLFFIVEEFYRLRDLEAYKFDSIHYSDWLLFAEKWKARKEFRIF